MITLPLSGFNNPLIILIVVVLPAPFGPKNPNISPRKTSKEISLTGVVFQLCHQGCQTGCYQKAEEIINNDLLGHVNLIEVCTNRNTPNGAWVYDIIEGSGPGTIDWKQFEGNPDRIKEYTDYMKSNGLERYMGPETRDQFKG